MKVIKVDLFVFLLLPIGIASFIIWRVIAHQPLSDGALYLTAIVYLTIVAIFSKR
jgi:hypothetical protein